MLESRDREARENSQLLLKRRGSFERQECKLPKVFPRRNFCPAPDGLDDAQVVLLVIAVQYETPDAENNAILDILISFDSLPDRRYFCSLLFCLPFTKSSVLSLFAFWSCSDDITDEE